MVPRIHTEDQDASTSALERLARLAAGALRARWVHLTVSAHDGRESQTCFAPTTMTERATLEELHKHCSQVVRRTGSTVTIKDLRRWAANRPGSAKFKELRGSLLSVPALDDGNNVRGAFSVLAAEPRVWQADEVQIVRDAASLVCSLLSQQETPRKGPKADTRKAKEASGDVLCRFDANLRILDAGARASEVWGYDADELVGSRIPDLIAPQESRQTSEKLRQVLADGRRAELANVCVRKDGTLQNVYWSVLWSADEQTFYAIARSQPGQPFPKHGLTHGPKILVVDDYHEIGLLVRTALQFGNFNDIRIASNPLRALEIARADPPDLVIADLRMEPLNGVELLFELRQLPGLHAIPFIIISGYLKPEIIETLQQAGVTSFIAKPFRAADVVHHVVAALDGATGPEHSAGIASDRRS